MHNDKKTVCILNSMQRVQKCVNQEQFFALAGIACSHLTIKGREDTLWRIVETLFVHPSQLIWR